MKHKKALLRFFKHNWGKTRCKGRCPNCALCRAWDCYDYLTLNDVQQPPCCEPTQQDMCEWEAKYGMAYPEMGQA